MIFIKLSSKSFCLTPNRFDRGKHPFSSMEIHPMCISPTEPNNKSKPSLKVDLDMNQIFFHGKIYDDFEDEIISEKSLRNNLIQQAPHLTCLEKEFDRVDTIDVVFQHDMIPLSCCSKI
jgi:hypothetical protein